jgi:IS30 family transposase
MRQAEYTSERGRKGSHFSYEQRRILEALWKGRIRDSRKLAEILGKDRRTIERELKRGTVELTDSELRNYLSYNADYARDRAAEQRVNHGPPDKIGHDHVLARTLRDKIKTERYSPGALVMELEREGWPTQTRLCSKTIYRYIDKGMIEDTSAEDLTRRGKARKRVKTVPKHSRTGALQRSIDKRPAYINDRSETGHWEMDTVRGVKNEHPECLLTLTERKSRYEIIVQLPDGKSATVVAAIDRIERSCGDNFGSLFKSITPDNGTEFSDFEGLERSCLREGKRLTLFFAHPYRAGERGTNENANGIIRRFFPKGTDFSLVSEDAVRKVQSWMNRYPRKILHGASPKACFPFLPSTGML